ncbi:hypothetical protein ACJBU6_07411 [Exserohilum turcicum]
MPSLPLYSYNLGYCLRSLSIATAKLNPKLERAMSSSPRSARRVVFGPEATWFLWYLFGCSPEYSAGLPKAIEENVQDARKMYTTLRCVALGPENNFVMIWQDGSKSYNLDENYSVLNQALDSCEGEDVSRIALNPNKAGDYFVYFDRTKTAMFQVSEAFGKDLEDALTAEGIRSTAIVRHRDKLARQTDILKMAKQSNLVGNVADTVNNETIGSSGSRLVTNGVSIGASLATFASAIVGVAACTVM